MTLISRWILCFTMIVTLSNIECNNSDLSVIKYANCVRKSLSRYSFLTARDRSKLKKLSKEMKFRSKNASNERVLKIKQFSEEVANLVVVNDTLKEFRKLVLILSLEECSFLVAESLDFKFNNESLTVTSGGENHKVFKHDINLTSPAKMSSSTSSNGDSEKKTRLKRDAQQFESSAQSNLHRFQSIESTISNVLLQSQVFYKVFHEGILQNNAITVSKAIIESGLAGFNDPVVNDAVNTIVNYMSFTTLNFNSKNYAYLLAKAISDVFGFYKLSPYDNGITIANNMILKLEKLLDSSNNQRISSFNAFETVNKNANTYTTIQAPLTLQPFSYNYPTVSPFIQPSPVISKQAVNISEFQGTLQYFLFQSPEISDLFCKGSTTDIFRLIKEALSDFGRLVSINTAIVAFKTASEMDAEQRCLQYSQILSSIIKDSLIKNDLLEFVSPLEISKKIIFRASQFSQAQTTSAPKLLNENKNAENKPFIFSSFTEMPFSTFGKTDNFNVEQNPESTAAQASIQFHNNTSMDFNSSHNASLPIPTSITATQAPLLPMIFSEDEHQISYEEMYVNNNSTNKQQGNSSNALAEFSMDKKVFTESPFALNTDAIIIENKSMLFSTTPPMYSTDTTIDFIDAEDFINKYMDAFETPPKTAMKDFYSDAVINDTSKFSEFLFQQMISSMQAFSNFSTEDKDKQIFSTGNASLANKDIEEDGQNFRLTTRTSIFSDDMLNDTGSSSTLKFMDKYSLQTGISSMSDSDTAWTSKSDNTYISGSNLKTSFVEVRPSFETTPMPSLLNKVHAIDSQNFELFTQISSISQTAIAFIKSPDYNFPELCERLNELATLVDIIPVPADYCSEIAIVDYLLHVMKEVTNKITSN